MSLFKWPLLELGKFNYLVRPRNKKWKRYKVEKQKKKRNFVGEFVYEEK